MSLWRVVALALVLAGVLGAAGDASELTPAAWAFRKPIVLPDLANRGFVEVRLDAEVYRDAAPSLVDLRIRDADGAEVGYILRRHERAAEQRARDLPLLDLVTGTDGQTRFTLDLGATPGIHGRVRLDVAPRAKNFRVPVRIETSADGRRWRVARAAGFIYVVEGETRAADTSVSYPASTARWVRVAVGPAAGEPLPVQGAAIITETLAEREQEPVPATLAERTEDAVSRSTVLLLDLAGRHPVDRLELEVADRTFHRVVTIEASDDRHQWRWVGSGAVSAIDTKRHHERQTGVRFTETSARYLRLKIQNLDDQPLRLAAVRLAGVRRSLAFEAVPGRGYVLDYGNPRATAPRYDVTRAAPYLQGERLPRATLGAATRLPPPPPQPWLEAQQLLLWGAMALAVVVLGVMLVRLARQIRASA